MLRTRLACVISASFLLVASVVSANGRLPGATELAIDPKDPSHVLGRATFGLVHSTDDGESWQWICEPAIGISGEYDPPMALLKDGTWLVLSNDGGALVSHDLGCSWSPADAPLRGKKGIDVTLDRNDTAHLLVITSSLESIDGEGLITFDNALLETRDSGKSWTLLSKLPADFQLETVEISASNPKRIYVSGTAAADALLGIVQRSDDGGKTWKQSRVPLPDGSGSLFISAVDPENPDRLWARIPARGDRLGLFPASLVMSDDAGAHFRMLADTQRAMFGFALSPDGKTLAYGGPTDGLYVGPSDGSASFEKVSELQVRCLRWTADRLYVCASEPTDPFSLGVSSDQGKSFRPLYRIENTCPQVCSDDTQFAAVCQESWVNVAPVIKATGKTCSVPWAKLPADAADGGSTDADAGAQPATDAGALREDAGSKPLTRRARSESACRVYAPGATDERGACNVLGFAVLALLCLRARKRFATTAATAR